MQQVNAACPDTRFPGAPPAGPTGVTTATDAAGSPVIHYAQSRELDALSGKSQHPDAGEPPRSVQCPVYSIEIEFTTRLTPAAWRTSASTVWRVKSVLTSPVR